MYNSYWIYISIFFILLVIVLYFFNLNPKFIIPRNNINLPRFFFYKSILIILSISTILLPLDYRWVSDKVVVKEKNLPIQILFDVSLSMAADDIQPSRYVAAKDSMIKLIKQLDGYNMSIVIFSWIPFVYVPFSTNSDAITTKFDKTNLGDFPPTMDFLGTAIWDAMLLWIQNLEKIKIKDEEQPWLIILLTDWDSNKWYDPMQVIDIAVKKQVPIITLWVWTSNYVIWIDNVGQEVRTSINIPLLQEIADRSWWDFYRILEKQSFDVIFDRIAKLIKQQEKQRVEKKYIYLNDYLISLMVLSLFALISIRIYSLYKIKKEKSQI